MLYYLKLETAATMAMLIEFQEKWTITHFYFGNLTIRNLNLSNMDEVKINKVDKWKHILIWFLITVLICIFDPPSPDKALYLFVIGMALIMTSYIIVYYAHFLYIFPKYLGKNVIKLIFTSFSIFIILLVINYTQDYYISTINGGISDFEGAPVYELAALLGIFFLIIVVMALGNYQNRLSIHKA